MCLRSIENMHQVRFLVIFIIINSIFSDSVQAATKAPFVIFQPGEFFDPFTENYPQDHHPSASATPQSNVLYSETNNAFIQPFWNLPTRNAPNSYPRTVAQTSGNAAEVDAQISKPNVFSQLSNSFNNKPKTLDAQLKSDNPKITSNAPKYYPRTIGRTSGNAAQVDAQIRQPYQALSQTSNKPKTSNTQLKTINNYARSRSSYPRTIAQTSGNYGQVNTQTQQPQTIIPLPSTSIETRAKATENHLKTVNDNLKTLRRLSAEGKRMRLRAAQTKNSQFGGLDDSTRAGSLVAEASGFTSKLVGQPSDLIEHASDHAASKSIGGGHSQDSSNHKSHSDKDVENYKSNHHRDEKDFKKYDNHLKKQQHSEKGGHENEHHDEAGHYKKFHEGKRSHKAAKFGEKKGHKRGHKTKGYHNKFHRDEYHREHKFYDDYNKEGYHEKHGDSHSHHRKKQGGHKNGGSHKSGKNSKKHGKKGHSDQGNVVDEHKGFDKEGGRKKYHKNHKDYHEKRGSSKGGKYGYTKEN